MIGMILFTSTKAKLSDESDSKVSEIGVEVFAFVRYQTSEVLFYYDIVKKLFV